MANLKGGYVQVDCKGLNLLAQSSQVIYGIRQQVEAAYNANKPIVAVNCTYGTGVHVTPIEVFCILEAGTYILTASILQVRIGANDAVTIENLLTN